ncbi:MAG TPA: hypothetical protein VF145_01680 [Chitinophagaceae bacterium]
MKQMINLRTCLLALLSVTIFSSCKYDVADLVPEPKASFTVTPVSGQVNRYALASTSTNSFRYDWDKGTGSYTQGKQLDTVYFPDKGTYKVRLLVYGQSGMDTTSQTVTVANDDPAALTPFKLLTGNSVRTWKLAPEPGALWIGPSDYSATWWANNAADVTARGCLFNDEYIFSKAGNVFAYDNKGDFYVDEEGGNPHPAGMPPVGCYAPTAIPAAFQAWANSGSFTFQVIDNNKIEVTGTGAHLGLYKAATPPMNAAPVPQPSVTYQIVSINATRMVLKLDYGWGTWQFTFVSI